VGVVPVVVEVVAVVVGVVAVVVEVVAVVVGVVAVVVEVVAVVVGVVPAVVEVVPVVVGVVPTVVEVVAVGVVAVVVEVVPVVEVGVVPVAVEVVLGSVGALVGVVPVVHAPSPHVVVGVVLLGGGVVVLVVVETPGFGAEEVTWVDEELAAGSVVPELSPPKPPAPGWVAGTIWLLRMAAYCFISTPTAATICAPVMPVRRVSSRNSSSWRRIRATSRRPSGVNLMVVPGATTNW
jgi:hypothetical protein